MSDNPFYLLNPALQKYINLQNWQDLNAIQKMSIGPILRREEDVVISAKTAGGKTEAAFLPALTRVASDGARGISILCISPLKALIDDQTRRLTEMCAPLGIAVTPWHGDIGSGRKARQVKDPSGVVLITPESLESLLIGRGTWLREAMAGLEYVIIDEFHAFAGTPRGIQLLSQLHRLEDLIGRRVVRIALSATFAEGIRIEDYLRPGRDSAAGTVVIKDPSEQFSVAVQVRGYDAAPATDGAAGEDYSAVARDIYRLMRGKTNLVFANSRQGCESIASLLQGLCEKNHVPNEFFAHHALIAKEYRKDIEDRLQEGKLPTTVLCTSTLELGIDIPDIHCIGQVDYPASVSSLRQRLGRSGRRDGLARLRVFSQRHDDGGLIGHISLGTFISVAMVRLLLEKWYEEPLQDDFNLSTLAQQTLSVIASRGSASADELHALLCRGGVFFQTDAASFAALLRSLAEHDLIVQMNDGRLTLGLGGEALVSRFDFFTSFETLDECTVEFSHRAIGRIPRSQARFLQEGEVFLLSGRAWQVLFVNDAKSTVAVKPSKQSARSLALGTGRARIHDRVAQAVYDLYMGGRCPDCLDDRAADIIARGREAFSSLGLAERHYAAYLENLYITPWLGNRISRTVYLLLKNASLHASLYEGIICLEYCSPGSLRDTVGEILKKDSRDIKEILKRVGDLNMDKYDRFLSRELREAAYARRNLDLDGAYGFLRVLRYEIQRA